MSEETKTVKFEDVCESGKLLWGNNLWEKDEGELRKVYYEVYWDKKYDFCLFKCEDTIPQLVTQAANLEYIYGKYLEPKGVEKGFLSCREQWATIPLWLPTKNI